MLTREQKEAFQEHGFVRLPGVFSRAEAARMEDRLWAALQRKHGVERTDPSTWKVPLGLGLQSLRTHVVFEPIGGPILVGAIDDLVGAGRWEKPKHWGQLLVSFPTAGETWDVPDGNWHTDFPYFLPADRVVGVLVFSFVGEVSPQSGGTLVVAGSHRVVARFIQANPRFRKVKMKVARQALMHSDPWLKALAMGGEAERIERFMECGHAIADIPVRVAELSGEPGDVVIGHPWLLHTGGPNCGDRPRFMRVQRIRLRRAGDESG
jgi:hypothetical protein